MAREPRKPNGAKADTLPAASQSSESQVNLVIGRIEHYREKLDRREPLDADGADELYRLREWWNNLFRSGAPKDNRAAWAVEKLLVVASDLPEIVRAFMLRYGVDADAPRAWHIFKGAVMAGPPAPRAQGNGPVAGKRGSRSRTLEKKKAVREFLAKHPNAKTIAIISHLHVRFGDGLKAQDITDLRKEAPGARKPAAER